MFPRNPLPLGPLTMTETDRTWADLNDLCCVSDGWAHGVDIGGRTVLEVRHPATGDGHRNAGTLRDEVYGATYCSAFGLHAASAAEFPALTGSDWLLAWQSQQTGSPMVAIEVPSSAAAPKDDWYIRTRSSAGNTLQAVTPFAYGSWEFFVVCFRLDDASGFVRMWHRTGSAPDVAAAPTYERTGFDTWQWSNRDSRAHETLGLYMSSATPRRLSFWGYGRASTPERAVELARLP